MQKKKTVEEFNKQLPFITLGLTSLFFISNTKTQSHMNHDEKDMWTFLSILISSY